MARRDKDKETSKKKNSRSLSLNFEGIGEGFFTPFAGEYAVKIHAVEHDPDAGDDGQMIVDFMVLEGKNKGQTFRDWMNLGAKTLWRVKRLLVAAGMDIPDEETDIDFDDLEGRLLWVTVEEREYNGERKANVTGWAVLEEAEDDRIEDDKKSKKSKKDDEDEDDKKSAKGKDKKAGKKKELEKISADQLGEMDEDDLAETVEKYSLSVDLDDFKTLRKKRAAVLDALEEADMTEED